MTLPHSSSVKALPPIEPASLPGRSAGNVPRTTTRMSGLDAPGATFSVREVAMSTGRPIACGVVITHRSWRGSTELACAGTPLLPRATMTFFAAPTTWQLVITCFASS